MATRLRFEITFTTEYEADPEDYGTDDPAEMVRIDTLNFEDDPIGMLMDWPHVDVRGEVVS